MSHLTLASVAASISPRPLLATAVLRTASASALVAESAVEAVEKPPRRLRRAVAVRCAVGQYARGPVHLIGRDRNTLARTGRGKGRGGQQAEQRHDNQECRNEPCFERFQCDTSYNFCIRKADREVCFV